MPKTAIITTEKNGKGKGKRKGFVREITRKTHRTHKGYSMKAIVKGQMTHKSKGRKR